ncbi:bifunctional DNA primase/polymerase [Streptomyces sp. HNM0574]|uniref:bifunctional DNA primase/polymerase n=1 Tax=Streptomyces sp. HNM0574 TaxID=2714954 RepID=UPI00146CC83B|nr:bifunctional DNA primase/polymerase [Streptomyces sp. HNM0574]
MEESIGVTPGVTERAHVPRQPAGSPLDHAVRYTQDRHWDVVPGTRLETVAGMPRCSCGDLGCAAPGAHPAGRDWAAGATGSASAARRMWTEDPEAAVLLPTGRTFDVLDAPETAGLLALARAERLGLSPGPVISAPHGRLLFLVLPGGAAKCPDLVRGLGWSPDALDLAAHGEGGWVAAPPTRWGARGCVQWARRPGAANRWLPDAGDLLPALAYACGREAALRRA